MSHFRHRRDNNEDPLVELAEAIGGFWLPTGPLDGWMWNRFCWNLCEIKDPKREGTKNEYTDAQKVLLLRLRQRQLPMHILRVEDDIYRLMGASRTA